MFIEDTKGKFIISFKIVTFYFFVESIFMLIWIGLHKAKNKNNDKKINIEKYMQTEYDCTLFSDLKMPAKESFQSFLPDTIVDELLNLFKQWEISYASDGKKDCFCGEIQALKKEKYCDLSLIVLSTIINNLKNINVEIIECYNRISPGGLLVVKYNNIEDTNKLMKQQFGTLFYFIFPFYWVFYSIIPKIHVINRIQEWICHGKNKILSFVELNGRLAYCGFDVVKSKSYNGQQYIIAQKTKTISDNPNPSFFMLIKLNRVGLYGNIIKINKLRSMYPYSEFLQKKIFEQNSIGNSGKFNNDPRITYIGRIFRKYWIDELPQLIDLLRGEIKLVGIRAMSQHYFSLYSKEYKDLYLQVKPGVISPIFDENNDKFEDIERIELQYLKSYIKHPIKTDWRYFWITLYKIIKGLRGK
ncbi:MAG: sugar transferase [Bacteroidales bacterium]